MCPHAPQRPSRHVVQMKGVCQGPRLPRAASVLANKMLPGFQAVQECTGFSKNELRVICEEGRLPRKASRDEQVAAKRKVAQPVPHAVCCSPKQLDVYRAVHVLCVTSSLPKGTPGAFRQPGVLLLTGAAEIVYSGFCYKLAVCPQTGPLLDTGGWWGQRKANKKQILFSLPPPLDKFSWMLSSFLEPCFSQAE